jgi:hypothetical protein
MKAEYENLNGNLEELNEIQVMSESQKININVIKELIRQIGVERPDRARIFNDLFSKIGDINQKTFNMLEKEKEDIVTKIKSDYDEYWVKGI